MHEALATIAALVLLICIYLGSRKSDDRLRMTIIAYVVGVLCVFTAIGAFSATTNAPEGVFLAFAAAVSLTIGTLRLSKLLRRRHRNKEMYSRKMVLKEPPEAKTTELRKRIPWNAWGIAYMGGGIGTAIGLFHSSLSPNATILDALWGLWGCLLLLSSVGTVIVWAQAQTQKKPTPTRVLISILKIPFLLGSYMIPGFGFWQNPYKKEPHMPEPLTRDQIIKLLAAWSVWGLLCATLAGLYAHQAVFPELFGAIFIVPAMVGWARYQGIITS